MSEIRERKAEKRIFRVFGLFLLGVVFLMGACQPPADKKPNIILILWDTARKDHIGLYGYARDTTPHLDSLARESVVFSRAVSSCPWTVPAVASLFTSLLPSIHGVNSFNWREESVSVETDSLHPGLKTLAEILREDGYLTGAFVANHWIGPKGAFDRGFDIYDRVGDELKPPASLLNEKALEWIEKNRDETFFAYLHYMDIHGPWSPPEPYDSFFRSDPPVVLTEEMARALDSTGYLSAGGDRDRGTLSYYKNLYDGEIRYVDHHLGALLAGLKELNLYEDSLIVVLSDHGEAFYEHGTFDHGYTVYSEEIDIPLVIKFPAHLGLRGRCEAPAAITDVGVTILQLSDSGFPYPTSGRNLREETIDRDLWSEELSTINKGQPKLALVQGDYKAIYSLGRGSLVKLYDLFKDPGERFNLLKSEPARAAAMEKEIKDTLKKANQLRSEMGLERSTAIIKGHKATEQLRSLGYLH